MAQAWDRESVAVSKRYMKTDWTAEEKAFKDGITQFRESIAPSNPEIFKPEEVDKAAQVLPPVGLAPEPKKTREIDPKPKEVAPVAVESEIVGAPDGASTILRTLAKEKHLPTADPLDELFFGSSSKPQTPAAEPQKTKAPPLKPLQSGVDPLEQAQPKAAAPVAPSAKAPPSAKKEPDRIQIEKPAEISDKKDVKPRSLLDGFDEVEAAKIRQRIVDKSMSLISDEELDIIGESLPGYACELNLEHYREVPRALDEKISEVSAKKDGIQTIRRKLVPAYDKINTAWDYVVKVGCLCSNGSSVEKRTAQVMIVFEDLYFKHKRIKSLIEMCDSQYEHLRGQHEAVSRLASFYSSIAKGELPSTMAPATTSGQALMGSSVLRPSDFPRTPAPVQPVPASQLPPVNPDRMKGLESFPSNAQEIAKKDKILGGAKLTDF